MNPILQRFATLSLGQTLVAAGFVTFVYWQTSYDDGARFDRQSATLRTELETEKAKEQESDRATARVAQLKESYEALTEQFKIVSSQIPSDLQMPEIIKTVDTMAKTSGILVKTKEPRQPIRENVLEALPIRVQADGTFAEMTMFFYNLSTIDRIYRVKSFVFQAPQEGKLMGSRLNLDVELSSFRFVGAPDEKQNGGGGR